MLKERLFVVTGNDLFARQERIKALVDEYLETEWREFNLEKFDGSQGTAAILDGWLTPPFWGNRRVLLAELQLEDANGLLSAIHDWLQQEHGQPDNVLILSTEKIDRRLKANKAVLQEASHAEYAEVLRWKIQEELYPWIEKRVRQEGKKIQRRALELLVGDCGSDKYLLQQTLEKLLVYLGEELEITEEIVRSLVTQTESDIFLLLDLLARRQSGPAYQQLQTLLLREPPEKILSTLGTLLTRSYRTRWYQHLGYRPEEIASSQKMKPTVVKMDLKRWSAYSLPELETGLNRLLELQVRTRRSRLKAELALEIWLGDFLRM